EIDPTSYSHFVYVLPKYFAATCRWAGLAELSGTQIWFSPDKDGIFRKGMVMQQMLHNFGLYGSWKDGLPFEDYSTAMGSGDSCPSAPELWRLGWATPLAQLTSSNLQINVFYNFTLPATYLGPSDVMIKIRPDWLGMSYVNNLYLALRVKAAGDRDLLETLNGKLHVHEAYMGVDNSLVSVSDPRITFKAAIDPRTPLTLSNYSLQIVAGSLVKNRTAINVSICYYLKSPTDCRVMQLPSPQQQLQSPPPSPTLSRSPPPAPKILDTPPSRPPPGIPPPSTMPPPLPPSPLPPSPLSPSPPPPRTPSPLPLPKPQLSRSPAMSRPPHSPTRPKPPTPSPLPPKPPSPSPPPPKPSPPLPPLRPPTMPRSPRTPTPPRPPPRSPSPRSLSSGTPTISSGANNKPSLWSSPSLQPNTLARKRSQLPSTPPRPPPRPPKKPASSRHHKSTYAPST
ncbi:hypothetical protein Vretifemale_9323, partial [Volvox reticuliferus]